VDSIIVLADKDLMLRVFNNLIKNAIQAIIEKEDAAIHINVKSIDNKFSIEFTDNGSGIKEEIQHKIFVPYFTTKGTGTGLGLAMVKQIIENHRGTITFTSSEGGTIFFITLPKI
ncbi:ATP-binding protein, partial [Crocinitomicaceae bacterium]|nr:ATP-binding protein [Crocinitomicaceae bacterium]